MRAFALTVVVLAVAAPWARADEDVDPEPRASGLRQLEGTWAVQRLIIGGRELSDPKIRLKVDTTYTFARGKVTVQTRGTKYTGKLKIDARKKPATLEITRDDNKTTQSLPFKLEKDELYLPYDGRDNDLSGQKLPVIVMKKEK